MNTNKIKSNTCSLLASISESKEPNLTNTDIHNRALLYLQSILGKHRRHLEEFPHMPVSIAFSNNKYDNQLIRKEQQYNIEELIAIIENNLLLLNINQRVIFDEVIGAVKTQTPSIFFVDGPDESGKTFLYK
ncbi:18911_t:CDS:2 [Gigaspora rosea]|nr:18911_t:CDS:2 [Gigaspora rosea]